ncbi:MAG: hypothetical protein HY242_10645 [Afipia sp.]|nr:hypothetical protein [Afipia sp.]
MSSDDRQVLKYRPRTLARSGKTSGGLEAERGAPNLARYDEDRTGPDDYRRRMIANLAAIAFTVLLTAAGIWLAVKLADLRNTQDCVLMGRRDCAHISAAKD